MIDKKKVLAIAKEDAGYVYRDLSVYKVTAILEGGKWLVDYELKDEMLDGGGPHYVILAETGEIISRRYEQ